MALSLSLMIGILGNITAVLLFLAPIKTFRRIVKNRSTEEFDSLPYIITLLNASLWTYYGVSKSGEVLVATINGFGVVVEIVYVFLFLVYAPPRIRAKNMILVGLVNVGFSAAIILITQLMMHGDLKMDVLGFVCDAICIFMYGSPLAVIKIVVTTKSVEYMPFLLSFFILLNGAVWTFYALLLQDIFLAVPNIVGCLLAVAQLVIYAIYCRNPKASSKKVSIVDDDLESEGHRERLLSSSTSS